MGKRVPNHEAVLQREGKRAALFVLFVYFNALCHVSRVLSFAAQVQDLRALLQHPTFEEDMWEERGKNVWVCHKVKDTESTSVNEATFNQDIYIHDILLD